MPTKQSLFHDKLLHLFVPWCSAGFDLTQIAMYQSQ